MYESSSHVQQGSQHHILPPTHNHHLQNGHANPQPNHNQNGNAIHHPPQAQSSRPAPSPMAKDPVTVVAIPSVSIQGNHLVVGNSQSSSTRSYTPLKVLGDGSFGTVWLCDWHGTLPPNTPLSAMQCGGGARPEWASKRLVAVKRMKRRWEGGWDECKKLKELESLRAIPFHPNIIPLYDFFLLPGSKELYFVFESMEGNLYHLIRARKGRALAGGLVSSIFRQVVSGLYHIHASGYFHRDMKPENVLVTTTGLFDYQPVSPHAPPNAPPEKDVVAIIKLADFGLARETKSKPPYTEYVSTRWYRAPEVLLLSRDYSNPVDMWALGTIMAELVNLKPLFPGSGQIDQIARICELLGDPSDEYGVDSRGKSIGGGKWSRGLKMARLVGFSFPKIQPKNFHALFDKNVPLKLIECISDLLKYDPDARLTSRQCLEHPYLIETSARNNVPVPGLHPLPTSSKRPLANGIMPAPPLSIASPRPIPPSHSHSPHQLPKLQISPAPPVPSASASHRMPFYGASATSLAGSQTTGSNKTSDMIEEEQRSHAAASSVWSGERDGVASPAAPNGWPMDLSPQQEASPYDGIPMDVQPSPIAQDVHVEQSNGHVPHAEQQQGVPLAGAPGQQDAMPSPHTKGGKRGMLGFPKKSSKWDIGRMFGHAEKAQLPTLQEVPVVSSSHTPQKRPPSSSTDSRSLSEAIPVVNATPPPGKDKKAKKEFERMQREAEKQRRAMLEKTHREQARAVMQKRNHLLRQYNDDLEHKWHHAANLIGVDPWAERSDAHKPKEAASGPIRAAHGVTAAPKIGSPTLGAAAGRYDNSLTVAHEWRKDVERYAKVRKRDFDDDHSMSSSDVHTMSNISFATVDSDPGPPLRPRPSLFGMNRMASTSSLRTSFDDFPPSVRSSNSLSLEQQFVNDFHTRASVDPHLGAGSVSPPPMQALSLGSTPWIQHDGQRSGNSAFIPMPLLPSNPVDMIVPGRSSPFDFNSSTSSLQGYPPSPGVAPKSAINPIFKVPPLPPLDRPSLALPPFSQLERVAEGEYPPLSPISFHTPEEDA